MSRRRGPEEPPDEEPPLFAWADHCGWCGLELAKNPKHDVEYCRQKAASLNGVHLPTERLFEVDERAHARRTDPDTSHAAAASVRGQSRLRRIILAALKRHGPMIDYRLIEVLKADGFIYTRSGIQTRRNELVALGLVRDTGRRVPTETRRMAIVWEAV